jgi:predicted glycogen debranching enzyme
LSLTADSFIAPHSILAGYHWFVESWGRDTFISLPGLLLVRKKFAHARKIFRQYAKCMRNGIIPNILPDRFNSADATLWFVYSLKKYYEYTGDEEFLKEMGPCMEQIVEKYPENKSISMDEDGLIKVSECLTWMDTKFTPRGGKPVEVNALWLNALSAFEELFGIECHSAKIKKNFSKFWNGQGLFDVLEPTDSSIRPNQIFAISLPHRLLSKAKEKKILKVVKKELLTPYGLRTLSASDKNYRGSYTGDESYHNGCVWPWLTGFYITAHMRIYGDADYCKAILQPLLEHLKDAGLGSISEIFDGDAPHRPNGCISQAWSVAEVLRCMHEDLELI